MSTDAEREYRSDRSFTGADTPAEPLAPAGSPEGAGPKRTGPKGAAGPGADRAAEEWERARHRVQAKREFSSHIVAYVVVNLALIGVWLFTGAGYFWPAWVIFAWGAGLVLHAWDVYRRRPITRADIDAEMHKGRHY